jgi:hypothetical protein
MEIARFDHAADMACFSKKRTLDAQEGAQQQSEPVDKKPILRDQLTHRDVLEAREEEQKQEEASIKSMLSSLGGSPSEDLVLKHLLTHMLLCRFSLGLLAKDRRETPSEDGVVVCDLCAHVAFTQCETQLEE